MSSDYQKQEQREAELWARGEEMHRERKTHVTPWKWPEFGAGRALRWVVANGAGSVQHKLLDAYLASFYTPRGYEMPTAEQMAEAINCSVEATQQMLGKLTHHEYVSDSLALSRNTHLDIDAKRKGKYNNPGWNRKVAGRSGRGDYAPAKYEILHGGITDPIIRWASVFLAADSTCKYVDSAQIVRIAQGKFARQLGLHVADLGPVFDALIERGWEVEQSKRTLLFTADAGLMSEWHEFSKTTAGIDRDPGFGYDPSKKPVVFRFAGQQVAK